ncbi:MAG: rod shape-determining protein MreD [Gammaproteobacteria bacterium]
MLNFFLKPNRDEQRYFYLIGLSLIIALVLTIIPLPAWAIFFRPQWVVLVLVYWLLMLPERVGLISAWGCGLFLDILQGTLLGVNGLAMVVIAYLCIKWHRQIRAFPLHQQTLTVFVMVLIFQSIVLFVQSLFGEANYHWQYWFAAVASMLLWPWVFILLQDCHFKMGVRRS